MRLIIFLVACLTSSSLGTAIENRDLNSLLNGQIEILSKIEEQARNFPTRFKLFQEQLVKYYAAAVAGAPKAPESSQSLRSEVYALQLAALSKISERPARAQSYGSYLQLLTSIDREAPLTLVDSARLTKVAQNMAAHLEQSTSEISYIKNLIEKCSLGRKKKETLLKDLNLMVEAENSFLEVQPSLADELYSKSRALAQRARNAMDPYTEEQSQPVDEDVTINVETVDEEFDNLLDFVLVEPVDSKAARDAYVNVRRDESEVDCDFCDVDAFTDDLFDPEEIEA